MRKTQKTQIFRQIHYPLVAGKTSKKNKPALQVFCKVKSTFQSSSWKAKITGSLHQNFEIKQTKLNWKNIGTIETFGKEVSNEGSHDGV